MLAHLQAFEQEYGVRLFQKSLCPRHAESISDRAQAVANTLIESSKDHGHVIGLEGIAAALRDGPPHHSTCFNVLTHPPLSALFPFHLFRAGMCRCWQGGIWSRVQALDDGCSQTRTSSPCESLNQRAFTV
jgi:hypothetical protein